MKQDNVTKAICKAFGLGNKYKEYSNSDLEQDADAASIVLDELNKLIEEVRSNALQT